MQSEGGWQRVAGDRKGETAVGWGEESTEALEKSKVGTLRLGTQENQEIQGEPGRHIQT